MISSVAVRRPFPLVPLLLLSGLLYLNFTSRVVLAPLLPLLEGELGLGHGTVGSFFFFQATGYTIGLLAAGATAWYLSHHGTIVLSAFVLGVSLLTLSWAPSLRWMEACLVLLGIGAGLYLPSGIATIADITAEDQWGRATAIHELAPVVGFITAPLVAEALLRWLSWRGILSVLGIVLLSGGLLYAHWGVGGRHGAEQPRLRTMVTLVTDGALMRIAALFVLAVAVGYGLYTMFPLFLITERGMDRAAANTLVGLSRLVTLPMVFLAGCLADRLHHRRALTLFQATTGSLTILLAVAPRPWLTGAALVLQAGASVCFFPAYYPLVSQLVAPGRRHLAISVVSLAGMLVGGGLTPALIGHLAERWSFSAGILVVGVLTTISPALLWSTIPRDHPPS